MVVVRKELEQTLPKTACPGHAVVGKVCLVTSPKTVFVCIWLLVIVCSSFARSLGWPCPRQHAKGMSSRVRCSEIPNLVCSSERSWFLANSVSDVYRCSTHVEQEKGCPYPALATPQLRYPRKNQFKRSSDHCSCDRMLRCGVRGVCPTQDFLTFCQIEEQFFGSDVCCPFVHLLMLLVIRICPFALVDAGRNWIYESTRNTIPAGCPPRPSARVKVLNGTPVSIVNPSLAMTYIPFCLTGTWFPEPGKTFHCRLYTFEPLCLITVT